MWIRHKLNVRILYLRGFDCGYTTLSFDDFSKWIEDASNSLYKQEEYHVLKKNCRNFCEHLLTEILRPSAKNRGEFTVSYIIEKKLSLGLQYLKSLISEQAWIGSLGGLNPVLGSSDFREIKIIEESNKNNNNQNEINNSWFVFNSNECQSSF